VQFMLLRYAYCTLGKRDRLKSIYRYPVTFLPYVTELCLLYAMEERQIEVYIQVPCHIPAICY
jgi:hypothetical protein